MSAGDGQLMSVALTEGPVRARTKTVKAGVDHIARGDLPWRAAHLTECGRPLVETPNVMDRDEAIALFREYGPKRCALYVCMTCVETCQRWPRWRDDPVGGLLRELNGVENYRWRARRGEPNDHADTVNRELRAMAALVEQHHDEFVALVHDIGETATLDAARVRKRLRDRS